VPKVIRTHGLTHLALKVADPERSLRFYRSVFGVEEYFRDATTIQAKGPGAFDVIVFEAATSGIGVAGGISHFGFRLIAPSDIDAAVSESLAAGGRLLRRGEFAAGFPFAYIADPDGYEIEIWYE
jgi:catechol 2,3-dioxygenase-like lactoylglutathione lyase family enzyme